MPIAPPPPDENQPLPLPVPDQGLIDILALRRSTKVAHLREPGPDPATLDAIIRIGARVPDHGKLAPWRFVVLEGEARAAYGARLADLLAARRPNTEPALLDMERTRFTRAPVVVAVVSTAAPHAKIPEWEQILSAGAACFGILLAARAAGFGGCWLSEWPTYDPDARAALGLSDSERIAGFLYLGTPTEAPTERARPPVADRVTRWTP